MWAVAHESANTTMKKAFFVCWVELSVVYEPWIVANINLCIKGIPESDSFVFKLGLQNLAVIHIWH